MERKENNLGDFKVAQQKKNGIVAYGYGFMCLILVAAYYAEVLKGTRSMGSYLILAALGLVPAVLLVLLYLRKKDSEGVRYLVAVGFGFLYAYITFTTTAKITFCYIILIYILISMYADIKLSATFAGYGLLINIVSVGMEAAQGGLTGKEITEAEVYLPCLLFAGVFSIITTSLVAKINAAGLKQMETEKEHLSQLLLTVREVSGLLNSQVAAVNEEIGQLNHSISSTKESMESMTAGVFSTVQNIQTQENKTEEIQGNIHQLVEVSGTLLENLSNNEQMLARGEEIMNGLIGFVEESEKYGAAVRSRMEELVENAGKMQGILALINSVASQTRMLSLNASIEAARAGAAGKGFAVVASEISNLASQTSSATGDINALIDNITGSLSTVGNTMDDLMGSNQRQNEGVLNVSHSFTDIFRNNAQMRGEANRLEQLVQKTNLANGAIVEGIQNISAITEEISAEAAETLSNSEKEKEAAGNVMKMFESLSEKAEMLKNS